MPMQLPTLIEPGTTAELLMEMQRGVVGDLSHIPMLVDAVRASGMVPRLATLLEAARAAGVQIIYCNAAHRHDRKGSAVNTPFVRARTQAWLVDHRRHTAVRESAGARATQQRRIVSRYHGMTHLPAPRSMPLYATWESRP
jgi:Amidases related to nicotinamidase